MKINRLFKIYGHNKRRKDGEKGQVLLIVLVLMLVGILFITGTMGFMSTSFKTNRVYINNTTSLYASEAGIQDGIWNILNQSATDLASYLLTPVSPNVNPFTQYDYNANGWIYHLYDPSASNTTPINVNTYPVDITVKNTWVPLIDDNTMGWVPTLANPLPPDGVITPPSTTTASNIENNIKLVVTGGVSNPPTYKISVLFTGTNNATNSIPVVSVGCWLPQGFTYNNSSSNLYHSGTPLFTTEQVLDCSGNEAVVWTFSSKTFYSLMQSMGQTGNTLQITFQYTTALAKAPECLSWFVDGINSNTDFPYPYTWDFDTTVYDMTGTAGNTAIEATIPKTETRTLGSAVSGDYVAAGASLMTIGNGYTPQTDPYSDGWITQGVRYVLLSSSSAVVNTIPSTASDMGNLEGAYLYWSGWFDSISGRPFGQTYGQKVNLWINGNQVCFSGTSYARGTTGISSTKNQWRDNSQAAGGTGYSYSCYRDVTKLVRGELQAENPTATSLPGNATYAVGPGAGCTLGNTGNPWSYAGWSIILIYSSPSTLGHQLYLYDTFTYADNGWDIDLTGTSTSHNNGGIVSGFLVPPQIPSEVSDPNSVAAKLTAFVGDGDWCYSDDFIAINAPSAYWSAPLTIPDSYKLWDGITLPAPTVFKPYGDPGLPNTAAQPDNVWNSYSQTGGASDGIDLKTFKILWTSGLIHSGDTSARIDLPTAVDSWNFIYLIVSFRSSVTSGGSISYLIKRKDTP